MENSYNFPMMNQIQNMCQCEMYMPLNIFINTQNSKFLNLFALELLH